MCKAQSSIPGVGRKKKEFRCAYFQAQSQAYGIINSELRAQPL